MRSAPANVSLSFALRAGAPSSCVRAVFASLLILSLFLTAGCSSFGRKTVRYIKYPVKGGDTLSSIGERFGVSYSTIADINDVDDPRALQIGQVLKIPYHGQQIAKGPADAGAIGGGSGISSIKAFRPFSGRSRRLSITKARDYLGKLGWPVGGGKMSSGFGWRWLSFHEGIDIAAPTGTEVLAAHDGIVVYSGNGISGYGNLIVVRAPELVTVYAHNHRNHVSTGERVKRGEQIAEVGATGHATGPHLHFETRIKDESGKNVAVDPIVFFRGN